MFAVLIVLLNGCKIGKHSIVFLCKHIILPLHVEIARLYRHDRFFLINDGLLSNFFRLGNFAFVFYDC